MPLGPNTLLMKIKPKLIVQAFSAITLKDLLWLVLFSLFAGHYLVSNREAEYFWELWMMKSYYPAMLGSFLIAFLVCLVVFYIDCCLNLTWPWLQDFYKRLLKQLQFGVVLPLCLLLLLVWAYFGIRRQTFDFGEYMRIDFGVSAILIVMLNIFCLCRYLFERLIIYYQPVEEPFFEVEEAQVTAKREPAIDLSVLSKMVYFYHSNRVNWAINEAGEMIDTGLLMDELEAWLPKGDFFRVQKGFIVHRESIKQPMRASSHRLLLYLNTPCHKALPFTEVEGHKRNYVVVSQRKVAAYREWYQHK